MSYMNLALIAIVVESLALIGICILKTLKELKYQIAFTANGIQRGIDHNDIMFEKLEKMTNAVISAYESIYDAYEKASECDLALIDKMKDVLKAFQEASDHYCNGYDQFALCLRELKGLREHLESPELEVIKATGSSIKRWNNESQEWEYVPCFDFTKTITEKGADNT